MKDTEHIFPSYFPENVPPKEATSEVIILYRLCKNEIPSPDDFIPFYLKNPERYKGMVNAYGLSVFPSPQDCLFAREKSPLLRKRTNAVAFGQNNSDRGVILRNGNTKNPAHITWWVYEGVEPHTFFAPYYEGSASNE